MSLVCVCVRVCVFMTVCARLAKNSASLPAGGTVVITVTKWGRCDAALACSVAMVAI